MLTLISQTREAMQLGLYNVALLAALSIPDIAGSLVASDGRATRERYVDWYETWVRPRLAESRARDNPFTGKDCYIFRCSMVHQGASHRSDSSYKKIIFIEPGHPNYNIHYCLVGGEALLILVDQFVKELLSGCELWLQTVKDTEPFETNYENFAKRHPNGMAPYVTGAPVIG